MASKYREVPAYPDRVLSRTQLSELATHAGIDLVGVIPAGFVPDSTLFDAWVASGKAAGMGYLTDHRALLRQDPRMVMPTARTVLVAGVLYNTNEPNTLPDPSRGWISRYAWGDRDYHDVVRERLEKLASFLQNALGRFEYRVCVDTAPLLERSLARQAGLGWIGKNTCLIHQGQGSWFFLGEILMDVDPSAFELANGPPPDRCGTCRRCIDACPTEALIPAGGRWQLDAARCISYWTIESRHLPPADLRPGLGNHVFGCDICQDVCPWNRRAPTTDDFAPVEVAPPLDELAGLTPEDFRERFRHTPVWRTKHRGLLRNVAVAMGNACDPDFRKPLLTLSRDADPDVAQAAQWALDQTFDACAEITLLAAAAGGRPSPLPPMAMPVEIGGELLTARLYFEAPMPAGSTFTAHLRWLAPERQTSLAVDTTFRLWDGRAIGHGVVTSISSRTSGWAAETSGMFSR